MTQKFPPRWRFPVGMYFRPDPPTYDDHLNLIDDLRRQVEEHGSVRLESGDVGLIAMAGIAIGREQARQGDGIIGALRAREAPRRGRPSIERNESVDAQRAYYVDTVQLGYYDANAGKPPTVAQAIGMLRDAAAEPNGDPILEEVARLFSRSIRDKTLLESVRKGRRVEGRETPN